MGSAHLISRGTDSPPLEHSTHRLSQHTLQIQPDDIRAVRRKTPARSTQRWVTVYGPQIEVSRIARQKKCVSNAETMLEKNNWLYVREI
jgi:hypothetical protein